MESQTQSSPQTLFPRSETARLWTKTPSPQRRPKSLPDIVPTVKNCELEADGGRKKLAFACAFSLFADMLPYGTTIPILPLFLKQTIPQEVLETATGVIFSFHALGLLIASPIIAYSCRNASMNTQKCYLIAGSILLTTSCCMIAFVPQLVHAQWLILITLATARLLHGLQSSITWTLTLALIAESYSATGTHATTTSRVLFANTLGFIAGQILGGNAWEHIPVGDRLVVPFSICAVVALLSGVVWILVDMPEDRENVFRRHRSISESLHESQSTFVNAQERRSHSVPPFRRGQPTIPRITLEQASIAETPTEETPLIPGTEQVESKTSWSTLVLLFGVFAIALVFYGIDPILPLRLSHEFDASVIGYVFIGMEIANGLSRFYAGHLADRHPTRRRWILTFGLFGMSLGALGLSAGQELYQIVLAMMIIGCSEALFTTPLFAELADVSRGGYAVVFAVWNAINSLASLLGPVLAGTIMTWQGFSTTLALMSGLSTLASLLLLVNVLV
jgi:MFS family permease